MNDNIVKDTIIEALTNLYKHDLAATEVYKKVIEHVKDNDIREKLQEFLGNHESHTRDLTELIEKHEGQRPSDWRDLKGYMMDLYTTIRSLTGQSGALKALYTAEVIVGDQYKKFNVEELDDTIADLIKKNTQDEKKHMTYLESLNI